MQGTKGHVLGYPEFGFLFRYRGPNPQWAGYVGNADCYDTINDEKPVDENKLGGFCPMVYGFKNFVSMQNDPLFFSKS